MKEYRVQVVATKTMVVTEEMWREDAPVETRIDFDEFQAARFAKGQLVEDLRNNPNRGSVKVERIK